MGHRNDGRNERKPDLAGKKEFRRTPSKKLLSAMQEAQAEIDAENFDDAIDILEQALLDSPPCFEPLAILADMYLFRGKYAQAAEKFTAALGVEPESAEAWMGLSETFRRMDRPDDAARAIEQVMQHLPEDLTILDRVQPLLEHAGQWSQAITVARKRTELNPDSTRAALELARVYRRNGDLNDAEQEYRWVLEQDGSIEAYNGLGQICLIRGQFQEACDLYVEAIRQNIEKQEVEPEVLMNNYANTLRSLGRTAEAVEMMRKAAAHAPAHIGHLIYSNMLMNLHYLDELDRTTTHDAHVRYGQIYGTQVEGRWDHDNPLDPDRPLRIGFVSPDFRAHSVNYFFESVLKGRQGNDLQLYGYGTIQRPDDVTQRTIDQFDGYCNALGTGDSELAERIQKDRIDILVDLAGHTRGGRLLLFARKPAPVQVTWLGYPDTTGLTQIDYRLTDEIVDPPETEQFHTEELAYMPEGFLCFCPPEEAPNVMDPPILQNDTVTFGCFCNPSKVTGTTVAMWSAVMTALPKSRLILKMRGAQDQLLKEGLLERFRSYNIDPDRIQTYGYTARREQHLALYSDVDIALDTHPYNGTTTTCEALWMGVPVITLTGTHHASRVSTSILHRVGLDVLCAATPEEYVAIACTLGQNPDTLREMRSEMRLRMKQSALCDPAVFYENLRGVFRSMWHVYCEQHQDVSVVRK
jgi:predicted O-linked N-acetylglucosamine transferase (SPINDLY family)